MTWPTRRQQWGLVLLLAALVALAFARACQARDVASDAVQTRADPA